LIFPVSFTCFENISWSIEKEHIEDVKLWFELWSKAGANPNFVVEDRIGYVRNFEWVANWLDLYFFTKVSDFLLSILFLIIFVNFFFLNNQKKKLNKKKYKILYIFIFLVFIEWFLKHPTLRYGGYHIIALMFLIPFSIYLSNKKINFSKFLQKTKLLLLITLIIFLGRNLYATTMNKSALTFNRD